MRIRKLSAIATLLTSLLHAQPKAFDVVSLKPANKTNPEVVVDMKPGGLFIGRNLTLMNIVQLAWNMKQSQIVGGPKWLDGQYDIDARMGGAGKLDTKDLMAPLQLLLADRCRLQAREETRPHSIFFLDTIGGKSKLTPSNDETARSLQMSWRQLTVHHVSTAEIAEILSRQLEVQRPVIDRTNLTGKFDFTLDFFPDPPNTAPPVFYIPVTPSPEHLDQPNKPAGSQISIFEGLRNQLGLKLSPGNGSENILIVDHIERPSAN